MSALVMVPDLCPLRCHWLIAGHAASCSPRGPPMARGVECAAREQSLWHQEPLTRVALRPVRKGPLGPVHLQSPPRGQPAQTLPHSSELRLALRLHSTADAHAPGGPKVSFFSHDGRFREISFFCTLYVSDYLPLWWRRINVIACVCLSVCISCTTSKISHESLSWF